MPDEIDVKHVDRHLMVVSKPPGLLSQPDRTGDRDVLASAKEHLRAHHDVEGDLYLGLVHRLDRPASGLMILARTSKAARRLSEQFREQLADKRYIALVEGKCIGVGTCVDYLLKEDRHVRVVSPDHPDGKRAELTWQSVAQSQGMSLLQVQLKTGRPHQIRVQLAERGHPIRGDIRYGASQELDGHNLALHAYHLAVEHPVKRVGQQWTQPPPDTWTSALDETLQGAIDRILDRS